MDPSKVVIVSGEARSGTSLMMQTLQCLGVPLVGSQYLTDEAAYDLLRAQSTGPEAITDKHRALLEQSVFEDLVEEDGRVLGVVSDGKFWPLNPEYSQWAQGMLLHLKHTRQANPKGYYEDAETVLAGFSEVKPEWLGKAMKVITQSIYVHAKVGGGTAGIPQEHVDKILLCIRNPQQLAESQQALWTDGPQGLSPLRYLHGMGAFLQWARNNYELIAPKVLLLDYDEMMSENPPLEDIVNHLDIEPTAAQFAAARANMSLRSMSMVLLLCLQPMPPRGLA